MGSGNFRGWGAIAKAVAASQRAHREGEIKKKASHTRGVQYPYKPFMRYALCIKFLNPFQR